MGKYEDRLFINGQFVEAAETFDLISPTTQQVIAKIHSAGAKEVDAAVAAAKKAWRPWAAKPSYEKAAIIRKFAQLIQQNTDALAELDAVAMGKPVKGYENEVMGCVGTFNYCASLLEAKSSGDTSTATPGFLNISLKEPYGVVCGIVPWNVPIIMWAMKVAPAVAAGNAILLKTSEKSPLSGALLAKLSKEAGFPDGVINNLSGAGLTGKLLAEHMEIRKIAFTGSTRTGRLISEAAAKSNLKTVSLELGGKSAAIVCKDADLDVAVPALGFSLLWNSGQVCMATTRVYVHQDIKSEFEDKYTQFIKEFAKLGDPLDKSTTQGPVADELQYRTVSSYLDTGVKEGKALIGGQAEGKNGLLIEPTVFTNVSEDAKINKEEIFGPVSIVHSFTDEDDAVQRANDSEYGLYASVFTRNINAGIRIARQLEAGSVAVNAASPTLAPDLPFGGYKQSGVGREGGPNSLDMWMETKSVYIKYA